MIEGGVEIGEGCDTGAHAVAKRFAKLCARNRARGHATFGGEPPDVKFRGERSELTVVGEDPVRS